MTELDSDIASTEHRLWMAKRGVNPWEIPALEARLVALKVEREHVNAEIAATVKPYVELPPRKIEAKWEPDFAFTPMLDGESFKQATERANRERGL